MPALTKAEREVVLSIADDERVWHVHTDSGRFSGRLKKVAAAWGVTPQKCGDGWEFDLPLRAVRFAAPRGARKPMSEEARAAARARFAEAKSRRNRRQSTEGIGGGG